MDEKHKQMKVDKKIATHTQPENPKQSEVSNRTLRAEIDSNLSDKKQKNHPNTK